jgi:4-amino-4-deoxy-L-arabinose transferase-like glycosyltransferase
MVSSVYTDAPRGIAHVVLAFVSLGFLTNGIFFAVNSPGSVGFELLILPLVEFGIAIAAALVGWLGYLMRRRFNRWFSTKRSHQRLAIVLALLTGFLWFGIEENWNTSFPVWLAVSVGIVAAAVGLVLFVKLPPGATRTISNRRAIFRAAAFSASSLVVAFGLPLLVAVVAQPA